MEQALDTHKMAVDQLIQEEETIDLAITQKEHQMNDPDVNQNSRISEDEQQQSTNGH